MRQLQAQLRCSLGYASDLCTGKEPVSKRIAERLQQLTGTAWHKWMKVG